MKYEVEETEPAPRFFQRPTTSEANNGRGRARGGFFNPFTTPELKEEEPVVGGVFNPFIRPAPPEPQEPQGGFFNPFTGRRGPEPQGVFPVEEQEEEIDQEIIEKQENEERQQRGDIVSAPLPSNTVNIFVDSDKDTQDFGRAGNSQIQVS